MSNTMQLTPQSRAQLTISTAPVPRSPSLSWDRKIGRVLGELHRRALAVNQDNLALGHETFVAGGARFVRNVAFPEIWDANHVDTVTASSPTAIDALLERAAQTYTHCSQLRFDVDARTPPQFEARLQLEGYQVVNAIVFVLEEDLGNAVGEFDIRPVRDAVDWEAYERLQALDWADGHLDESPVTGRDMGAVHRAKSPPVRYWLGFINGEAWGYLSSWEGNGGVGQVEDLFVHPAYRHRGLATALLRHGVRDCRAHGAHAVVIVADANDTPKDMYAAMGWCPVAVKREYRKAVGSITQPGEMNA